MTFTIIVTIFVNSKLCFIKFTISLLIARKFPKNLSRIIIYYNYMRRIKNSLSNLVHCAQYSFIAKQLHNWDDISLDKVSIYILPRLHMMVTELSALPNYYYLINFYRLMSQRDMIFRLLDSLQTSLHLTTPAVLNNLWFVICGIVYVYYKMSNKIA